MKSNMYHLTAFVVVFCFSISVFSQPFTEISTNLMQLTFSQVSWADYDNDGDLDVFVFGMDASSNYATRLYRNDGGDVFTEVTDVPFIDLAIGSIAWGDYDNDGDLDLLIEGANNNGMAVVKLYNNKGADEFVEANVSLLQVYDGSARWADYDNDGYLDMLLCGFDDATYVTKVYNNNQDGTFSEQSSIDLPGMIKTSVEWADYDKDGDMDFIFFGLNFSSNFVSILYKNMGNGTFADSELSLPGVWLGDAAWGDYDMDGDPDFIMSGFESPGRITELYQNNGDGTFTQQNEVPFIGVSHSALEWGDYDNDGDPDLFLCGVYEQSGWVYVTEIYDNNGDGTFSESGITLANVLYWGDAAWGDYDADGDLDLIQAGYTAAGGIKTVIYRNDNGFINTPPNPPGNLIIEADTTSVSISWDASTDNETPPEGLSYNAYIYKQDGDTIWSAMALSSGYRLLPSMGNTTQNTSWTIKNLEDGIYFWSVQALDNNFEGSAFAPEESFTIGTTGINDVNTKTISIYPNPATNLVNIKSFLNIISVDVYNYAGQLVAQEKFNNNHGQINTMALPSGIYFLRVKTVEGTIPSCIIIE